MQTDVREALAELVEVLSHWPDDLSTRLTNAILAGRAALAASPQAEQEGWQEYGATDFGYTLAGITVSDGGKRLMSLLVRALGSDHPAVDDLTALLFAAAPKRTEG